MSRWKSPRAAAKQAEHAAREAEKRRIEKRNTRLLVIAFLVATTGLTVGDFFWMQRRARNRREQHERLYHKHDTNNPTLETNVANVNLPEGRP